ncbi:hypothetical protein [Flavobacterium notoginsengisoli]
MKKLSLFLFVILSFSAKLNAQNAQEIFLENLGAFNGWQTKMLRLI